MSKKANPLLELPAAVALLDMPAELRRPLERLLRELSADAEARAQESWKRKKGPMAAYWKACAVYSKHTARALAVGNKNRPRRLVEDGPLMALFDLPGGRA